MGARRRQTKQQDEQVSTGTSQKDAAVTKTKTAASATKSKQKALLDKKVSEQKSEELKARHLAPLPLVMVVMLCSGALWVLSFRDLMSTGRSIAGPIDDAFMHFTKSSQFYDDSKGFVKSKAGGLSAIESVTTDANNMGGLFVRKMGAAASLAVHSQKLLPLLFHPDEAHFGLGHFNPMLVTSVIGNVAIAILNYSYLDDMKAAGAGGFGQTVISLLILEAVLILYYVIVAKRSAALVKPTKVATPKEGKTPGSITNRIVMRTVATVSGFVTLIFGRDLFFPGQIIPNFPRDDIYLEWTGAFLHSPPSGTPEARDHSLEAPLYVGDKYLSQMAALCMLVCCLQKFVTAFFIRYGVNRSGEIKCGLIWKSQAIGSALVLFILRLFVACANSASLDLRWHLMAFGYETFIIGLYGFFP